MKLAALPSKRRSSAPRAGPSRAPGQGAQPGQEHAGSHAHIVDAQRRGFVIEELLPADLLGGPVEGAAGGALRIEVVMRGNDFVVLPLEGLIRHEPLPPDIRRGATAD